MVLIVGGGTGAMAINKLVEDSLNELTKICQIIHLTGSGKSITNYEPASPAGGLRITNYMQYEFLSADKMSEALSVADLVISRAGLGVLSELSYLGKPSIIIPMSDSHQEENAEFFKSKKAAIVISQKDLTAENFIHIIKDLLANKKGLDQLANNMRKAMKRGANQEILTIINKLLK